MTSKPLVLFLFVLFAAALRAEDTPAPYGYEILRAEDGQRAAVPETREPRPALPREDRERLGERIEALERVGGPYDPGLEEPLYQLARDALERGLYTDAERLFRRGLHVLRVNEGLYSRRQEELVRLLLRSLRERGDYEALDGQYAYLYRLAGAGQPPWSEARQRAIADVLDWRREAILRGIGDEGQRLYDLQRDSAELRERVSAAKEPAPGFEAELVLRELDALYLILDRVRPLVESPFDRGVMTRRRPELVPADLEQQRLDELQRRAPAAGDRLVEDFLERHPAADRELRWRMRLALGDWQRFSGRWRSARETWQKLYHDLVDAQRHDLCDAWWGKPVELPARPVFRLPDPVEVRGRGRYRLRVDARGVSRDVELLVRESGEPSALIGLSRGLRDLVFRPRLVPGGFEEQTIERSYLRLETVD